MGESKNDPLRLDFDRQRILAPIDLQLKPIFSR